MEGDWRERKKKKLWASSNTSHTSGKTLAWGSGGSSSDSKSLAVHQIIEENKEMSFMGVEKDNNVVKMLEEGREEQLDETLSDEESAWEWVDTYDELIKARTKNQVSLLVEPYTFAFMCSIVRVIERRNHFSQSDFNISFPCPYFLRR